MQTEQTSLVVSLLAPIVEKTVKHYCSDFEHDKHNILADESNSFVWYAHKSGTHMYSRDGIRYGKANGWSNFAQCVPAISTNNEKGGSGWFYWDGHRLLKVTTEQAKLLVEGWEKSCPEESIENMKTRYLRGGW